MSISSSARIKESITVLSGYPFASQFFSKNDGMPLIRIRDLLTQKIETYYSGPPLEVYIVHHNDILIGMDGDFNIVRWQSEEALLNQRVCKITSISSDINQNFLFYWLQPHMKKIEQRTPQTTVKHLSVNKLEQIPLPPFSSREQRLIAHILDTLDTQIQQTEQLIAKLKQMKAGLLHDLLTRGIDENGDMRDPVEHPEQFKEEYFLQKRIKLPKKWEIVTLGSIIKQEGGRIQTGPFGSQLHAYEYVSDGNPVIMPQDIEDGHISTAKIARISPAKTEKLARHRVEFNDVIFARRGDISRCASITAKEFEWLCGTGCLLVKLPKKILYGPWLANVYRHDYSQRQILARAVGSTMINLNTRLLSNLVIMQACYHEQVAIATKIESHDARITAEETELAKLKQLKKGLMHDLLTGCVRVTPLMTESEQLDVQLKSVSDCK